MSENRRGFRSFNRDDGAEPSAVRMTTVRWKEVVLLRADTDVIDRRHAGFLELRAVGRVEVEEGSTAFLSQESHVELRRDFLADLVTTAADARPYAGPNVATAVLVLHEMHGCRGDAGPRAAPARVHQAGNLELRVPQHDWIAVRVCREQDYAPAIGEQRVYVVNRAAGLVDSGHRCSMDRSDRRQLGAVEAEHAGKCASGCQPRSRV